MILGSESRTGETRLLTEDQTGGTTPQAEANASDTTAVDDHAVATQVADEPATIADATEASADPASTSDSTDGTTAAAVAEVVEPDSPRTRRP